jgi:predicted PurR-regulated permease PerM
VYFAVGFGVYKFVPLALAGVTREFASLFHEIPNLFNGLKTQREKLYAAIESKLRYDALPTEVRHDIEVEFLRTWAARHPKVKDEGGAGAPADHVAAARPDALPPYEEESPEYLAFKRDFFDYLKTVVDATDTYDLLIAGSPKEVLPLEQLKRLEQRVTAIVREIRDHLSERKYEDLEKDLREAFEIAARESQSTGQVVGDDETERPPPIHAQLFKLWREDLKPDDKITGADVDDLSRRIRDVLVQAFSGEKLAADVRARLDDYVKTMQAAIIAHLERISSAIPGIIRGIFTFFVILMIAAFFIVFFPKIKAYGRDLFPPEYHDDYESVLQKIDARLSGVIRGQFIICLVNGGLTYAGLAMLGLPLAPTLATIAGVLSLIPIFGTILSTIPAVIVALSVSPESGSAGGILAQYLGADNRILLALCVIGWVCIIHAIESYILNPNIMGQSAHMNPLIIVFALLAGEHVGGIIGALLAVPIASIFVTLFAYLHRKTVESIQSQSGPASGT